ncbi:MAG: alpha/beta hydrolase [Desulfobacca sp.]|nr:alpha/beta hydrolase [Desulfobacca sp.]
MPYFSSNGLNLFYEEFGSPDGPPILFLNGIMMNTLSWYGHKSFFKNYRGILFDFRDQGKSEKVDHPYGIEVQVDDLRNLLRHLDIKKLNLVGVSYGGHVALQFASQYSERISSLTLANTIAKTNNHLRAIGKAWEEAAKLVDGAAFFTYSIPFIYSRHFYQNNLPWLAERQDLFKDLLTKEWFEAFIRLSTSAHDLDVTAALKDIHCPTLLIGADQDMITPIEEMILLHKEIAGSSFVIIKDAGHAAVLEKPIEFALIIIGFIELMRNNNP